MENSGTVDWRRPALITLLAALILAAAVGWRMYSNADDSLAGNDLAAGDMSVPVSLEDLRAAAENAPDDAQAWQRLAFAYFTSNMFPEAVEAYEKAVEIAPDTSVLWSSLGEARVMASNDEPLPEAALQAFRRALEIDSGDPRARYFMAVEKDLAGDHQGALGDWLALLADTPPGAPWENDLVRTIEQVGTLRDIEVGDRIVQASRTRDLLPPSVQNAAAGGIPGPTQEQLSAASSIPPSQQQDMAESMVARLAARLESDPANVDGWIMLMRSYITLGRQDDARAAYRSALQANPAANAQLQDAAATLGLQANP